MTSNIDLCLVENQGFLCDYEEQSCQYRSSNQNGEYKAYYICGEKEYVLEGAVQNGKKEGKATMSCMGIIRFQLNYEDGKLMGPVIEMDEQGIQKMRGQLVDGMESGIFEEYDRYGQVVWRGYYQNGKRFSRVVKSERREGFYDEWSEANNELISSSEYDELLHDKNGQCLEYENGILKRSGEYENGKRIHEDAVCRESIVGMTNYYKEYDSNGHLCRICEYDDDCNRNGTCYDIQDGKVNQMSFYCNDQCFRVFQSFDRNEMTEYDDNGKPIYIGGFLGNMLRGFFRNGDGKEYVHGAIQYSGYFVNGKREGFGTEFEKGQPIYQGHWRNGWRNGTGKNRNETEDSVWMDGMQKKDYAQTMLPLNLPPYAQVLDVSNGLFNETNSLCLYGFCSLKTITIRCECFQNTTRFDLIGLNSLEKVTIENKCFRKPKDGAAMEPEGECYILDCPCLSAIVICNDCFYNYKSLHLASLPSLKTLELGDSCFYNVSMFALSGWTAGVDSSADLPCLESIYFGSSCLSLVHHIHFGDLPRLRSITLDACALCGHSGNTTDGTISVYRNTLTMKNLPVLKELIGESVNFYAIGFVYLENIPQLKPKGIDVGVMCFENTVFIQSLSRLSSFCFHSMLPLSNKSSGSIVNGLLAFLSTLFPQ